MFKIHIGDCKNPDCNRQDVPIVVKDGWCDKCNYERKQAKKKAAGKKTGPYKYKREATGEANIFEIVLEKNEPICYVCKERISLIMAHNFAHVLPKGRYPKARLDPNNIRILCYKFGQGCHERWDFGVKAELTGDGWDRMKALAEELKKEYSNL
jgi:5-methylcytosine-specific restriction endonuclease McrA